MRKTKMKTTNVLLLVALLSLLSLSMATPASASPVLDAQGLCPDRSADAWVNYCIEINPQSKSVPVPDATCWNMGEVEPVTGIHVPVPENLACLTSDTDPRVVTYYMPSVKVGPHLGKVISDACNIISTDPPICAVDSMTHGDSTGDGLPDGTLFANEDGEPLLFVPYDAAL